MIIVLVGPPASGKGTLGEKLSAHLGLPLIKVGQMLREIPPESPFYNPVHNAMNRGLLAPQSIVGELLAKMVEDKAKYEKGYILDGWLRDLVDLEYFDPKATFVLYLNISKDVAVERINNRLVCTAHGHTYNKLYSPPKVDGICDYDRSTLTYRKDDDVKVLENRFKVFDSSTKKVIEYYRKKKQLIEVDAKPKPEIIFNNTVEALRRKADLVV